MLVQRSRRLLNFSICRSYFRLVQSKPDKKEYAPAEDPGRYFCHQNLQLLQRIWLQYTVVMGASFRNVGEITELAGCDRLTIAPALLKELQENSTALIRKLEYKGEEKRNHNH